MSMQYSDEDLEKLLSDTESDLVERKTPWKNDAPDSGRQAVCAFANDLPDHRKPGVLFVGARDDGTPSGLTTSDELLRTLSDIRTDGNILPPPPSFVEKRTLAGSEIAVVTVQPSDTPPVRYKGRIWVRIGPRKAVATNQEERILNEKRRYRDMPFDVQPIPLCNLSALSRVLFEQEYLPNALAPDVLASNDRSYEQKLSACRMIASVDDPTPTILGVLVLGISPRDWVPGAYIQFLRIAGTRMTDPIQDEAPIDGALGQVLRRIDEKIEAHNRIKVEITSADRELRTAPYPAQDAPRNAFSEANLRLQQLQETLAAIERDYGIRLELIDMGTKEGGAFPIHHRMYEAIASSDIIICDLTGQRPNVFLEAGFALRHHEKNRLIFIFEKQKQDETVPFDLTTFKYVPISQAAEIPNKVKAEIIAILLGAGAPL